jgi:hypothetical protein
LAPSKTTGGQRARSFLSNRATMNVSLRWPTPTSSPSGV